MLLKLILIFCFVLPVYAFDHQHKLWDEVLQKYTKMQNKQVLVNYKGIKQDVEKLNQYLKQLSSVKIESYQQWDQNARLAFLINAYNAFTVKLVVDHYPVNSIKEIAPWYTNPWEMSFIDLLGEEMHLDNIEHNLIRKKFNEPRIHFAVNCASISCPSLLQQAFVGTKLDAQLERATKHFLKNSNKNYYDAQRGERFVSRIFKWYGDDFDKEHGSVKEFLQKYCPVPKDKKINLNYLKYDWSLNEYQ